MQISCERCSTVYMLDDKLIPPGGAPVQCTRCGLVFTAKPPAGTVAQPPPPKPTAPPASARLATPRAPMPSPASVSVPDRRATMMFGGGQGAPAPQPSPQSTMMFGAAPAASPVPPSPQSPSFPVAPPAPAAGANATMMFGSAPSAADLQAARTVPVPVMPPRPAAPAPAAVNSTMMFGSAPALAPAPSPAPAPAPAAPAAASPSSTMMFGAMGNSPAPEGERAPALEMPAARGAPAAARRPRDPNAATTDPNLAASPTPPMQPAAPAPSWAAPVAPEVASTPSSPPRRTGSRARAAAEPTPRAPEPELRRDTPPAPERVRLPPQPKVGAQTMELQMALKKRQRFLPIALGAVVALLVVGAGTVVYLKARTPPADPALVAADGKALALLEQDDTESITRAIAYWEDLEKKAPEFVPLKANQIMAHVFLTQDLRDEIRRLTAQAQQIEKDMKRYQDKKEPADWLTKAQELRDKLIELKEKQVDPMVTEASAHDERAGELLKSSKALVERLGVAGDGTVVFRASAIYYASKGHETAEKLADFYRKHPDDRLVLHDDGRAFADLAVAGRFAQTRITPEDRQKGAAAAEEALKKNPRLLRAHLFLAKMYFANHEYPQALAAVDKLIALNPAHAVAAKLKAEIEQAAKIAEKTAEAVK